MKWFKHVLVQTGLWSGLIAGASGIVLFYFLYNIDLGIMDSMFRIDFWIPLPFFIFSLYYFRKRSDALRIWQGFVLGGVTVLVSAFVYIVFLMLFMQFIDTNYLQYSVDIRVTEIEAMKIAIASNVDYREEFALQYPQLLNAANSLTTYSILLYKTLWHLFARVIYTVFISLLFRK